MKNNTSTDWEFIVYTWDQQELGLNSLEIARKQLLFATTQPLFPKNMKPKVNEHIRLLRLQRGYSQENMADSLSLSTTAYGDIERGKTDLTLTRLAQIADVLGVDSAELLTGTIQESKALEAIPTPAVDTQHLQLIIEKQQLEIEKLSLEVDAWKRQYERAVARERLALELMQVVGNQAAPVRERIGF